MYDPSDKEPPLERQFRALIQQALPDPRFRMAGAGARLGLSQRTLYRRCRELTGQTPSAYLRDQRLARARQLLESGKPRTVAEAAFAVGMEDVAYFARLYYRRYRQRPSELLK